MRRTRWCQNDRMADVTTAPGGLRERKKAQVHAAIQREGQRLFSAHGFEATTVEAIAAACDVSPATVYRYFPTKEDIVFADAERQGARLAELIGEQPSELSPNQALYRALRGLADEYVPNRTAMRATARMLDRSTSLRARKAEAQHRWEETVVAALKARESTAGHHVDDTLLRIMTATALSSFRVATELWLADKKKDLHTLVDLAAQRLTDGFGQ
jgi:AcrR family transcriptional regulator